MNNKFSNEEIETIIKLGREKFKFNTDERTFLYLYLIGDKTYKGKRGKELYDKISSSIEQEVDNI